MQLALLALALTSCKSDPPPPANTAAKTTTPAPAPAQPPAPPDAFSGPYKAANKLLVDVDDFLAQANQALANKDTALDSDARMALLTKLTDLEQTQFSLITQVTKSMADTSGDTEMFLERDERSLREIADKLNAASSTVGDAIRAEAKAKLEALQQCKKNPKAKGCTP